MKAGELNKRLIIQKPDDAGSGWGGETGWHTHATVWAAITGARGTDYFTADQEQSEVTHLIKCRYVFGVTAAMRINFQGRIFAIKSVINVDERNRELHILAREDG